MDSSALQILPFFSQAVRMSYNNLCLIQNVAKLPKEVTHIHYHMRINFIVYAFPQNCHAHSDSGHFVNEAILPELPR